ncbi:MAG: choice-of-anchor tandem repeat GloVer-containing protein [Candidatus Cybelea sp.]
MHSFQGSPDGYVPTSALVSDNSGRLYGVTDYGGVTPHGCNSGTGCGTFFTLDPSSRQETVLYSFGRTRGDGQLPNSLLFYDGSFYGTTEDGGTNASLGTVFKITPDRKRSNWNETILHRFRGSPNDGASPMQLTIDASGIIYGTAGNGGSATKCFQGCGAVFKLTHPSGKGKWQEAILHSFAGVPDGIAPSDLILAPNRTFYGETGAGGRSTACGSVKGCGTIFALKPSGGSRWTETIVHSFQANGAPKDDGEFPFGGLVLTSTARSTE